MSKNILIVQNNSIKTVELKSTVTLAKAASKFSNRFLLVKERIGDLEARSIDIL